MYAGAPGRLPPVLRHEADRRQLPEGAGGNQLLQATTAGTHPILAWTRPFYVATTMTGRGPSSSIPLTRSVTATCSEEKAHGRVLGRMSCCCTRGSPPRAVAVGARRAAARERRAGCDATAPHRGDAIHPSARVLRISTLCATRVRIWAHDVHTAGGTTSPSIPTDPAPRISFGPVAHRPYP